MPEPFALAVVVWRATVAWRRLGRRGAGLRGKRGTLVAARLHIPAAAVALLRERPVATIFRRSLRSFLPVIRTAQALRVGIVVVFVDDDRLVSAPTPQQLPHDQVLRKEGPKAAAL